MSEREASDLIDDATVHQRAAETFVSRVRAAFEDEVDSVFVFGSTASGEASGLASDVDVLVVFADDGDRSRIEDTLRDIAYDVMLEYGPVVELHVLSRSEFEALRDRGNPFVENVVSGSRSYG